jgi:hypothetical protein
MKNVRMSSIMGVIIGVIMTFIGGKGIIECFTTNNFSNIYFGIICFVIGIVAWVLVAISDRKYDMGNKQTIKQTDKLRAKGIKIHGKSQ